LRYFFRQQCSHLREALKLVAEVREDRELEAIVGKISPRAQDAFVLLADVAQPNPSTAVPVKFHGVVKAIRNKVSVHYDSSLIAEALGRRAGREDLWQSSITFGENIADVEYKVAHQIEETIAVRFIFGIDDNLGGAAFVREASEVLTHATELSESYAGFCQEFCVAALRKYGAQF
jgi:hypothetical protein